MLHAYNWTQAEIAELLNIKYNTLRKICNQNGIGKKSMPDKRSSTILLNWDDIKKLTILMPKIGTPESIDKILRAIRYDDV